MLATLVTAAVAYIFYLLMTLGSGTVGAWSVEELISGAVLAVIAGLIAGGIAISKEASGGKSPYRMLNPLRLLTFLAYLIGPFFWAMAKANLDVAYRVITGKIRPGIVRISPGLQTELGTTLLANSITLTPGTLSVDVDDDSGDLFVHWINVTDEEPTCEKVCGGFANWARRIAE